MAARCPAPRQGKQATMRVAPAFVAVAFGGMLAVALAPPAAAKHKKPSDDGPAAFYSGEIVFTAPERTLITGYFTSIGGAATPQGKPLPPGIAKKLARGGSLPPRHRQALSPARSRSQAAAAADRGRAGDCRPRCAADPGLDGCDPRYDPRRASLMRPGGSEQSRGKTTASRLQSTQLR